MDKYEDATLRKVLAVTLDPASAQPQANPPVVYLGQLAQVRGGGGLAAPKEAQIHLFAQPQAYPPHHLPGAAGHR